MAKKRIVTIDSFFKKSGPSISKTNVSMATVAETTAGSIPVVETNNSIQSIDHVHLENEPEIEPIGSGGIIRDPGLRPPIWDYSSNELDQIRRGYIQEGPYQPKREVFKYSSKGNRRRRFKASWYRLYPDWLEYSPTTDGAYCLPCYLFRKPSEKSSVFISEGFRNWRKVGGNDCSFKQHMGRVNSSHDQAMKCMIDLRNSQQHIDRVIHKYSREEIAQNRLRLQASIDSVRWLTNQGLALRGHNEKEDSLNRGNFLELLQLLGSYNDEVAAVTLKRAPQNAIYSSPKVQKEILELLANRVRKEIRQEIGNAKFCILVDESADNSNKEQMAVVLRYVTEGGFIQERLLDLIYVPDTTSKTLKDAIFFLLNEHGLSVQNIRGQGYDGASNMSGKWNGLRALVSNECRFAYFVHCFAHQLQLALVAAAKEVRSVHDFFENKLPFLINFVGGSCKRIQELRQAQSNEITMLVAHDDVVTGRGLNQIQCLQRPGETRWGSHYNSVSSLLKLFSPVCTLLEDIRDGSGTSSHRGDADAAYKTITNFEFVFILHMMKEILEISNDFCQLLQRKSQDILNAMDLLRSTKVIIQQLRDAGWEEFMEKVKLFCEKEGIAVPEMSDLYTVGRARNRQRQQVTNPLTVEHHYHFDLFNATIDFNLAELNNRFNETTNELMILCVALDPRDGYKMFNIENIWQLVEKYYPEDFTDHEKDILKIQLRHYKEDITNHPKFKNISLISELCQTLVTTGKSTIYPLVDRLIRLVLTLPVSTASAERSFSHMNHIKTRNRNKMDDKFLSDSLVIYAGKEIAEKITTDSIIDDYDRVKSRRVTLR